MKGPGKSDDSPGMQVTNPDPYAFTKSIKNPSNRENADVADIYWEMTPAFLREIESVTDDLSQLLDSHERLVEAYYERNQILLSQQRIAKLRAGIDRERQRIAQRRNVVHRRKDQDRHRKQSFCSSTKICGVY
jgi:hypothetical protein